MNLPKKCVAMVIPAAANPDTVSHAAAFESSLDAIGKNGLFTYIDSCIFGTGKGVLWWHLIDLDIEDLIDAHDEAIPTEKCQHTDPGTWQEQPVNGIWIFDQCTSSDGNRSKNRPTDGMRPEKFPERR